MECRENHVLSHNHTHKAIKYWLYLHTQKYHILVGAFQPHAQTCILVVGAKHKEKQKTLSFEPIPLVGSPSLAFIHASKPIVILMKPLQIGQTCIPSVTAKLT